LKNDRKHRRTFIASLVNEREGEEITQRPDGKENGGSLRKQSRPRERRGDIKVEGRPAGQNRQW